MFLVVTHERPVRITKRFQQAGDPPRDAARNGAQVGIAPQARFVMAALARPGGLASERPTGRAGAGTLARNVALAREVICIVTSGEPDEWSAVLVRVGASQDLSAFQALFDHFAPRLRSRLVRTGASRPVADDVVQETFLAIWRKSRTYDPDKASAAAWIFTIARNKRIDTLRKQTRPEPDINDPVFAVVQEDTAAQSIDARQRARLIRNAVEALPEAQRAVLMRSYFDEQTHTEIAESLRLPVGTVKSRIRLALEKLQAMLPPSFKDDLR